MELYKDGTKHDTLKILLALLDRPRVSMYRRGATSLLIANITMPDIFDLMSPIDANEYALDSLESFYTLLWIKGAAAYPHLARSISEALALLNDCWQIRLDKAIYEEEHEEYQVKEDAEKKRKQGNRKADAEDDTENCKCDIKKEKRKRSTKT